MSGTQTTYNDKVVRQFAVMTVIWGIVGMLVGVIIAAQLVWPELNLGPGCTFGRLRPLHTNAVIFAFGGAPVCNVLLVRSAYLSRPLWGGPLVPFTFWGWQMVIVLAAITLPLGITQQGIRRVADRHPDHLVWVSYALVFFGTIAKRKVSHIYVANWFFGAFIIAVALLHIVNSMEVPVSLTKSYSLLRCAGCDDPVVVRS
jgi:cytochrome c oxidase cbb3-type subunit 1